MTRKPAEDGKAGIIAALLALADSIGPDRVTTGALAAAVGVTRAALIWHLPSKPARWALGGRGFDLAAEGARSVSVQLRLLVAAREA